MNNYISRDNYMLFNSGKVLSEPLPSIAPYTLRFLFLDEDKYFNPLNHRFNYGTWTQRSDTIWDWTYNDPIWTWPSNLTTGKDFSIFCHSAGSNNEPSRHFHSDLFEVKCKIIDSNTTDVTNMRGLFHCFGKLEGIEQIDTSNVTDAAGMFSNKNTYSAAQGLGSIRYINSTLDFRKVSYYNGTSCHGRLTDLFYNPGYDSIQSYRLIDPPEILWPDPNEVGYVIDLKNAFYLQRNIRSRMYADGVYPSYYLSIEQPGSYHTMCYRCGDLGNPTAYAAIPGELRN